VIEIQHYLVKVLATGTASQQQRKLHREREQRMEDSIPAHHRSNRIDVRTAPIRSTRRVLRNNQRYLVTPIQRIRRNLRKQLVLSGDTSHDLCDTITINNKAPSFAKKSEQPSKLQASPRRASPVDFASKQRHHQLDRPYRRWASEASNRSTRYCQATITSQVNSRTQLTTTKNDRNINK